MFESVRRVLLTSWIAISTMFSAGPASGDIPLVLNELMASNGSAVKDPQNEYDDWIEIHNPSGAPVDAAGLYLTDDPTVPTRWQFPLDSKALTTVPAGGFLVIWADGPATDRELHASFNLDAEGGGLYLFASDGATLIDAVEFDEQIRNISYGRHPDGTGDWHFMTFPTPGMTNVQVAAGVLPRIEFGHERGFYDAAFELTMSCGVDGATIYYTLDGSEPYVSAARMPAGLVYTKPVRIVKTTCLRAIAIKQDWVPSPVETHSYVFTANAAAQPIQPSGFPTSWGGTSADYQMDPDILSKPQYGGQLQAALMSLPSMSIVMTNTDLFSSQTGIYANPTAAGVSWERPCSIELIYPDGTDGFQVNCGARIQGGAFRSASNKKHSFRIVFKGIYGPTKLRYPLFGEDAADEFDTIVLRAGANDGYVWGGNEANVQYTRDQFMRDLQHDTGNAASHGRFVHLYVNGLYWGLYNPCERPDGSFCSSYYGSEKEDWDMFKHKGFTLVDPEADRTALNQMLSLCQEAGRSYEAMMRLQGKGLDGARRPEYPCLLDLTNYIDYMIVNLWGGNWDWPWNNYWLGRDRTDASTGFKFFCWDAEDVMLTSRSPLSINMMADSKFSSDVGQPHSRLKENPEYRMLFADRVHRLFFNDGILTPGSLIERYTAMTASIEQAMIPEAARWADQHGSNATPANWVSMRDRIVTTYLPQRSSVVLGHLRTAGLYPNLDAPVFSINGAHQHGGHVSSADPLAMQANSAIYYTLDGSDPRVPSTETNAGGSTAGILVAENAAKRVLVPTAPVNNAWRGGGAFDDSAWLSGSGGVGFERSTGYEQYFTVNLVASMYAKQTTCYLRIPFTVTGDPAAIEGLQLSVRYDDGFVAWINGVEVARRNYTGEPAWNSAANAQNSDDNAVNFEGIDLPAPQNYLRAGQNTLAIQAMNQSSTSSDFLISVMLVIDAETPAAPGGVSATAVRYAGPMTLTESTVVKARSLSGATWSALNEAVFAVGPVAENLRVSEILYHPAEDPNAEFIELTNVGSETINLSLVRFTKGISYSFPSFKLPGRGYCLLVKDVAAFEACYGANLPVVGQYTGSLSNAGENIEYVDAMGQIVESFKYEDNWFDSTDGSGFSLTVTEPGDADPNALADKSAWRPSTVLGGSPGTDDEDQVP